ncbi:MAG: hypothetical protein PUH21_03920 [Prevotellaceae bacterium]|nr:hypothetical protein [Prevotellaceae bacterium]MDY3856101.1 hypothetical protein [Bacteroidaceae bacterium]
MIRAALGYHIEAKAVVAAGESVGWYGLLTLSNPEGYHVMEDLLNVTQFVALFKTKERVLHRTV